MYIINLHLLGFCNMNVCTLSYTLLLISQSAESPICLKVIPGICQNICLVIKQVLSSAAVALLVTQSRRVGYFTSTYNIVLCESHSSQS